MHKNKRFPHLHPGERGQNMIEFALVLPVLLLIMFGIIEFGRLLLFYAVTTTSAREGARYGAAAGGSGGVNNKYQDCNGIRTAALRMGNLVGMQNNDTDIQIRYDKGPSTSTLGSTCPPGGSGPELAQGDRILVTTTAHFEPILPLIHLSAFNMQAVARRTILVSIEIK
jgi:hypothetical protein